MSTNLQLSAVDVRPWLENHAGLAAEYTVRRINHSYTRIEQVLAGCEGLSRAAGYDIGCHAGLDSFAMAAHFDRVLAIDPNGKAIEEAETIARGAGVTNIRFDCARAEYYDPAEVFSFVFCNLMSHNVDSRCLLAVRIAMALEQNGWLHYAEENEGYAPMVLHHAIQRQDPAALSERLRQMLRGFTGTTGFRFYASGTMEPPLKVLGLRCVSRTTSAWNGMQHQETMLCIREGNPSGTEVDGTDPDYLRVPDDFQQMRDRFGALISSRPADGFSPLRRAGLEEEAENGTNRYGPFLHLLLMADLVLPSLDSNLSPRLQDVDWKTLEEIDRRFIGQMRRRAGLEEGPIDD